MNILVAGFGNVLRRDDGFGVALLARLREVELPPGVTLLDVGIGGISLVQELLTGFDALIVLDALDGAAPGRLLLLHADVPDADELPPDFLADVHYAEPGRALVLAKAMGVLPPHVYLVGCEVQATDYPEAPDAPGSHVSAERLTAGLTPAVAAALEPAARTVLELLTRLRAEAAAPAQPEATP